MKRLSAFFYKLSSGWLTLAALAGFLLFAILVLPTFTTRTAEFSHGAGVPDLKLFYTGSQLFSMAEAYGAAGRQAFIDLHCTLDLVFPLIYTFFFATSTSWLLRKGIPVSSRWRLLNLVPLAAFILDICENSGTSLVMMHFPQPSPVAQFLAPIFTPLKWISVVLAVVLLFVALVLWIVKVFQARKPS